MRPFLIYLHRYVGLLLAPFLVIVGLTGSALAFYHELDRWLNPSMLTVPIPQTLDQASLFDPFALHERTESQEPRAQIDWFDLTFEPGQAYRLFLLPRIDPTTGKSFEIPYNELYFNPYNGEQTGARTWGEISLAKENIMSFLYRLHYTLAFPKHIAMYGITILGVVALLWFIDSFVGLYLTIPSTKNQPFQFYYFWQRWKPAWKIKPSRFNYDLHRANGLWVWPILLILAWSATAFNLPEAYQPIMSSALGMRDPNALPKLDKPIETPGLDWRAAHRYGQHYIHQDAAQYGFTIEREQSLFLDRQHGAYHYRVKTDQDFGKHGATVAVLDANTGALISLTLPDTDSTGDIVHRWITWLHTARVFGLPMQIAICITGLIVVTLSITGIIIWLKKRKVQKNRLTQKL